MSGSRSRVTFTAPFERLPRREAAAALLRTRYQLERRGALWVFAYGSLLWRPCYEPTAKARAVVKGYARSLCVWTLEARGTPAVPGIGLGLEAMVRARCDGEIHQVARSAWPDALRALWSREMWTGIYRPRWVPARANGRTVWALAFVADPKHPQFAGELTDDDRLYAVRHAAGKLGTCRDYVVETHRALKNAGIRDEALARLLAQVDEADLTDGA